MLDVGNIFADSLRNLEAREWFFFGCLIERGSDFEKMEARSRKDRGMMCEI